MRQFLLLLAIIVAGSSTVSASDVTFDDVLGRWCQIDPSDGAVVIFSRTDATVILADGRRKIEQIAKVEVTNDTFILNWAPLGKNGDSWYQFSPDRQRIAQLGQVIGDKGPRREFRRC
jgi:hypothetical protein